MKLQKGTLIDFHSGEYKATIRLTGSRKGYLENVPVARNLPAQEMVTGRRVAVAFFEAHITPEAVVIAVYQS